MSISSEINRISQNVSDSLTAVASKGATVPSGANSDDLPDLIASLPSTHSVTYNLTSGVSASVTPSKVVAGQGFSLKLTAPTGYALSGVTITMGGVDITSQVFTPDESGGSPSATQHSIYFEFTDSTNTTITGYWDDSFISNAITATTPTTYGSKTVSLAQLDGVTWYDMTSGWELVHEGRYTPMDDYGYYIWIPAMASIIPTVGSEWRITIDSTSYECTAKQITGFGDAVNGVIIGNQKYIGQTDDGSGVPFCFYNYNNQAWSGDTSLDVMTLTEHYIKIERKTS